MTTLQDFFYWGMDRVINDLVDTTFSPGMKVLNLGPGQKSLPGAVGLGLQGKVDIVWRAGTSLPYEDKEIDHIHAYHFFEHLTRDEILDTIMECQRVLKRGGTLNIVVPYAGAHNYYQDLDHKSAWNEETLKSTLDNRYYDNYQRNITLRTNVIVIMAIVIRNLALLIQLVNDGEE